MPIGCAYVLEEVMRVSISARFYTFCIMLYSLPYLWQPHYEAMLIFFFKSYNVTEDLRGSITHSINYPSLLFPPKPSKPKFLVNCLSHFFMFANFTHVPTQFCVTSSCLWTIFSLNPISTHPQFISREKKQKGYIPFIIFVFVYNIQS